MNSPKMATLESPHFTANDSNCIEIRVALVCRAAVPFYKYCLCPLGWRGYRWMMFKSSRFS